MTQNVVLYRLVGMVDVTFNIVGVSDFDGRQLRQGLEALEIACSRRARVRECQ